jgi:hypothetical protein
MMMTTTSIITLDTSLTRSIQRLRQPRLFRFQSTTIPMRSTSQIPIGQQAVQSPHRKLIRPPSFGHLLLVRLIAIHVRAVGAAIRPTVTLGYRSTF